MQVLHLTWGKQNLVIKLELERVDTVTLTKFCNLLKNLFFHCSYSSDQNMVGFVKEGSVGLRLVGGNDVGIFVGGIQPNSPAQREGMREGDQILQVGFLFPLCRVAFWFPTYSFNAWCFTVTQVNGVDFAHFTREEAAMFLMNIRSGERINMLTQNKMDSEYTPLFSEPITVWFQFIRR